MISCTCENRVHHNDLPRCRRCKAFQTLGLEAGTPAQEIRAAYYVLVKVWHPNRFEGDKALKEAAEAKLKDINSAYMFLCSPASMRPKCQQTSAAASAANGRSAGRTEFVSRTGPITKIAGLAWTSFIWIFPTPERFFKFVVIAIAILLGGYAGITLDIQHSAGDRMERVVSSAKDSALEVLPEPERRILEAVEQNLKKLSAMN